MATIRRNDPVRLLGRRALILLLLIIVVFAAFGVWRAYGKNQESGVLRAQAESRLSDLSGRQAQLTSDIAKLETERGKEEALRGQYAVAAKGEGLIVIVDSPQPPSEATSSSLLEWFHKAFLWW